MSHRSHINHEFFYQSWVNTLCDRKFYHLQKGVDNDVTYEENFPTSKILVSFLLFNMTSLLQFVISL